MSGRHAAANWVLPAVVSALLVGCAIGLVRTVSTLGLMVPFDPNEGWIAYFASAAISGQQFYPPAQSFLVNNYPPLSFYLVGGLGHFLGDMIVAGRVLSFAGFAGVALGIFVVLRIMACKPVEALFAVSVFMACLLLNSDYVGMDDPQLLGHAVAMAGLIVLLQDHRRLPGLIVAALLFTLAFFIKHNLVILPLAITVWLAVYDRRSALSFAIAGLACLLAGLAICRFGLGVDLIAQLHSARVYSLHLLAANLSSWLICGFLPIGVMTWLSLERHGDKYVVLCALYALAAILTGAAFFGGAGVDANAMFDADIALALGAGLALNRFARRGPVYSGVIAAAFVLPLAFALWQASSRDWLTKDFWLHPMADDAELAGQDIEFLRAHSGPALCETLAFCYWAGKSPEVDVFNTGQQFLTQSRSDRALIQAIDARRFAALQFDALAPFALGPDVHQAVVRNYRVDHSNDDGVFFVRR
jgi:hypothetical protein